MSTNHGIDSQTFINELFCVYTKTKSLSNDLETSNTKLEVTCGLPDTATNDVTPDQVDRLCEKTISILNSISANYRKFCDLTIPERRAKPTRQPREDSGIGSGIFNSAIIETFSTGCEEADSSIQEEDAAKDDAEDVPEKEPQRVAMENSDEDKSSIC